jgi:divalent metal cation (Fe/Co/Zn/Cd) transporter
VVSEPSDARESLSDTSQVIGISSFKGTEDPMGEVPGKKPVTVFAAMGANALVALSKFLVAAITRSSAMLSEGIHSLADTGNQALLLLGIHLSRRPADANHPFGYGKEIYFWSLIVAIVLFGVGGGHYYMKGLCTCRNLSS